MAMGNHVSVFQGGRIVMSNRQHALMKTVSAAPQSTVRVEEIMGWHQGTLGSCKHNLWLTETRDRHGVKITGLGRQALNSYLTAEFYRKHESFHFAACLTLEPPAHLMAAVARRKAEGKMARRNTGSAAAAGRTTRAQAHAA